MQIEENLNKTLKRIELYNLVWSTPISRIVKDYALSNTGFKNLCKEFDIPIPQNGYWQKLKHHKKVVKLPLIETDKVYKTITLPIRLEGENNLNSLTELQLLIREIKNDKSLPQIVPDKLINPEKITKATREYFKKTKKVLNVENQDISNEGVLSIAVSDELKRRALIFIDTLIKLLKKRGHRTVVLHNEKYFNQNGTKLIVNEEIFDIRIREAQKRVMEKHPKYDWKEAKYYSTGRLVLKIEDYPRYEWSDGLKLKLEDKLPNILAYLEIRANQEKANRIENEKWHLEYENNKKKEEELKKRRDIELNKFKAIINQSSRWQKSIDLRNYIEAVKKNAQKKGEFSDKLKNWLEWIEQKVDWYDPFIESEDEVFKNVDRDTLMEIKRNWL